MPITGIELSHLSHVAGVPSILCSKNLNNYSTQRTQAISVTRSKLVETVERKVVPYLKFEVFPFTVLQHLIVMKNWQSISSHTVVSIWKQFNICIQKRERLKIDNKISTADV